MQLVNQVIVKNIGIEPIVGKFSEAFVSRAIYCIRDLYSKYDQFQLVEGSKNITTMRIFLGLVKICTLQ